MTNMMLKDCKQSLRKSSDCFNGSTIKNLGDQQLHLSHSSPNLNALSKSNIPFPYLSTHYLKKLETDFPHEYDDIAFIDKEDGEDYCLSTKNLRPSGLETKCPTISKSPCIRYLSVKVNLHMNILQDLTNQHDQHYLSVSFGENVIKEMIMSSVYGIQFNANTALFAYNVMMQRVQRVARNFSRFNVLPLNIQDILLQQNSDFIVSLHGAAFFQFKQTGLEQILRSLSYDDHDAATSIIATMKQSYKANYDDYKGINYQNFNSIQEKRENTSAEIRYNKLLAKIGSYVVCNQLFLKLLVYILLLTIDFDNAENIIDKRTKAYIEKSQKELITVLEGCIFETYSTKSAEQLFRGLLECLTDLKELCYIKKNRRLAQISSHTLKTLISSV